jgi:hypothetical protein
MLQKFCDDMDEVLKTVDAIEYQSPSQRFWWVYSLAFCCLFMVAGNSEMLIQFPYILVTPIIFFHCIGVAWYEASYTVGGRIGVNLIRDVRLECDAMTDRIPFVTFHAIMGAWHPDTNY